MSDQASEQAIQIQINGETKSIAPGMSIRDLLLDLNVKENRVAVEHNREIVKPDRWEETKIRHGDELEVVHFVGGGTRHTTGSGQFSWMKIPVLNHSKTRR